MEIFCSGVICIGLEPDGVCALAPARFTVETFSAGRGEVTVTVINGDGQEEEVILRSAGSTHYENAKKIDGTPVCYIASFIIQSVSKSWA